MSLYHIRILLLCFIKWLLQFWLDLSVPDGVVLLVVVEVTVVVGITLVVVIVEVSMIVVVIGVKVVEVGSLMFKVTVKKMRIINSSNIILYLKLWTSQLL